MSKRSGSNKNSKWNQKLLETIAKNAGLDLEVTSKTTVLDLLKASGRQEYEIELPHNQVIKFSCLPGEIMNYVSWISTQVQLLQQDIDFEEWFKDWQENASWAINRTGSSKELKTNYPIRKTENPPKDTPLNQPVPGYLEWKHPTKKKRYLTIEYFPEGKANPEESHVLYGSVPSIISDITRIHSQPKPEIDLDNDDETTILKGHPKVSIYFSGSEKLEGKNRLTRAMVSFRLMELIEVKTEGYTSETVITTEHLNSLSDDIKTTFNNYVLKRGPTYVSYQHKLLGYSFWGKFASVAEGKRLFETINRMRGHNLDESRISSKTRPFTEISTNPKKETILGKSRIVSHPIKKEDLHFTHATIKLPMSRQNKILYRKTF